MCLDYIDLGLFDIRRSSQFIVNDPNTGRRAMGRLRTKQTADQYGAFRFPGPSGVAGYFYTKPPATIAPGQTVTLDYSIEGSTPEWGVSDPTDMPPATMHLFLWRDGDDLSCDGVMASYRFWAPSGVMLKLGDGQTLTSVLDPSVWTNCYGEHDTTGFVGTSTRRRPNQRKQV
jgi:hypothetical protein